MNIADIKCFTCGKPARFFDIYREHYYCEDCTQDMLEEQVEHGYRREESIAFETCICRFVVAEIINRFSSHVKTITTSMSSFSASASAEIHAATSCSSRMIRRSYAQPKFGRNSNGVSLRRAHYSRSVSGG